MNNKIIYATLFLSALMLGLGAAPFSIGGFTINSSGVFFVNATSGYACPIGSACPIRPPPCANIGANCPPPPSAIPPGTCPPGSACPTPAPCPLLASIVGNCPPGPPISSTTICPGGTCVITSTTIPQTTTINYCPPGSACPIPAGTQIQPPAVTQQTSVAAQVLNPFIATLNNFGFRIGFLN